MRPGLVLAALLLATPSLRAAAPKPKPPANDDCLACHEDSSAKRADGSSVFVDKKVFAMSVHGSAGAACVDCHADQEPGEQGGVVLGLPRLPRHPALT